MGIKRTLLGVMFVLFAQASWADVHTAASGALIAVQAACDEASPGDVVAIPAGTYTWASALRIRKPLTIAGAGSGTGGTKLISTPPMSEGFIDATSISSTQLLRITGIFFEMKDFSTQVGIYVHSVDMDNIRIDHNVFNYGSKAILFYNPKGLIDNNRFYNGNLTIEYSAGSVEKANASWESMEAGTADALFIEDNYFVDDASFNGAYVNERIGTFNGGKLVVRYNHFESYGLPLDVSAQPIMTHGSAAGGVPNGYWQIGTGARRGQSVVEIYRNIMEGRRIDFPAVLRGSANLVFENEITTVLKGSCRFYLREEEYDGGQWVPARKAWPGEDQVHNTFIWNNTWNGTPMSSANIVVAPDAEKIKENRDYFLHEPRATGGKAIFTGKNGASGSFPTDGVTWPTLGTMVFQASGPNAYYGYVPFAYPHPLRAGDTVTAPKPPEGLRIRP